jgi:hypothetical protein
MFRDEANIPGMLLKVKDKILNNINIKLRNVEILYEDSIALGHP